MNALLKEGYARAKVSTRHHAKSFYFSSFALWGERRRAAFALYSFCRHLDDLVDGDNVTGNVNSPVPDRLAAARRAVASLYGTNPSDTASGGEFSFHPAEFAAFRHTVQQYAIPRAPFDALIDGMEMDLTKNRYANFAELDVYCERVAGVVGAMMTPVLGYTSPEAMPYASDLGRAMQLTNILRDVGEDAARGRIYLPQDELASFSVSESDILSSKVTPQFVAFMRFQVARARSLYCRADTGIAMLKGFGAQTLVRVMSRVYGGILGAVERQNFDVFSKRAHLTLSQKCAEALKATVLQRPSQPALQTGEPLPSTGQSP